MSREDGSDSSKQRTNAPSNPEQERQAKAAREQMMRLVFSTEARERLNNIRMVKPELASSVENQVFQLAASGRIRKQITDDELKEMLSSFQQPKREFKINWK
ncbi:MAG: DNA-binding protein [Nitrososphaerales archaeon]